MARREKRPISLPPGLAHAIDRAAGADGTTFSGGSRQASPSRLLALYDIEPMSDEQARHVGGLAGRAAHDYIVDVTVVDGAIRRHDGVVTSNEDHIRHIAGAAEARLRIAAT